MSQQEDLEALVRRSLLAFLPYVRTNQWWGKEREAVSFYAFGFLLKECRSDTLFHDPAQLAIESRVRQVKKPKSKREVCKDLAIWAWPGMSCWDSTRDSTRHPLVIMEWKVDTNRIFGYDRDWLIAFSANKPDFTGLCVSLDLRGGSPTLNTSLIRDGIERPEWLTVR